MRPRTIGSRSASRSSAAGPPGSPAPTSCMQLLEDEPELTEKLGEVPVAVIEKGKVAGAHLLSGANMKPSAMEELFPDLAQGGLAGLPGGRRRTPSTCSPRSRRCPLKPMPPNFHNHGNYVTSVSKLGRFLAEKAEEAGVYILSRDRGDQAAGRGPDRQGRPLRRPRPRQGGRGARPTSSPAPTSSPRRPCSPRARSATSPTPPTTTSTCTAPTRCAGSSGSKRSGR